MRMGKVFNGHDLLDQPEHGAGCPVDNILGVRTKVVARSSINILEITR